MDGSQVNWWLSEGLGGRMNGARMYGWIVVGRWMDRWGKEWELVVGSRPPRMRRWTGWMGDNASGQMER